MSNSQVLTDEPPPYLANGEMDNFVQTRERRFTTITMRELRYPAGCPCHPKNPEAMKRYLETRRDLSPDARPSPFIGHSRPQFTKRNDSNSSISSSNSERSRRSLTSFFRRRPSSE